MNKRFAVWSVCLGILIAVWSGTAEAKLTRLVKKIQPAVVKVITYDLDNQVSGIGSGFFVHKKGYLITNYHVLKGAYSAEVKTLKGDKYPVESVVAQNEAADLIKVRIAVGRKRMPFVNVSGQMPAIAERVVVVGSPLGLDQTVSEGIVSAIRDMPQVGRFFQMSAPISPGSSGSPVVNMQGKVVGVATFQAVAGQNLNFAVAANSVLKLKNDPIRMTLSEWTYAMSEQKPKLAAELCRKGFNFSIAGETKKALEYYRAAARKEPENSMAWYGLGYCYAGLDRQDEAIYAYKQAIRNNPDDPKAHYNLASYYNKIARNDDAIVAYRVAIEKGPEFGQAYFDLGLLYMRMEQYSPGKEAFEQVTRIEPENAPAYFYLGLTFGKLERYKEALKAHREVVRISPDYAPAHYKIGVMYRKLGRPDRELKAYKQAIKVDPDFAPAHYSIGHRYHADGNKDAALAEYKILKNLDPDMAERLFEKIYKE